MSDPRPTTEELLAAYASGALRGPEAAEVEELLARDPAARAELEAMRDALAAVRAAEPRPAQEPDWDQMARDIRAACAEARRPGLLDRLRAALRPRHAVLGVAVAAACAVMIVAPLRRQPAAPQVAGDPAVDAGQPSSGGADPRVAEVDDLGEAELEALDTALGPDLLALGDPDETDDPDAALTADDLADWAGAEVAAAPAGAELELGMFEESGYDELLAAMSEEELDALEAALVDG